MITSCPTTSTDCLDPWDLFLNTKKDINVKKGDNSTSNPSLTYLDLLSNALTNTIEVRDLVVLNPCTMLIDLLWHYIENENFHLPTLLLNPTKKNCFPSECKECGHNDNFVAMWRWLRRIGLETAMTRAEKTLSNITSVAIKAGATSVKPELSENEKVIHDLAILIPFTIEDLHDTNAEDTMSDADSHSNDILLLERLQVLVQDLVTRGDFEARDVARVTLIHVAYGILCKKTNIFATQSEFVSISQRQPQQELVTEFNFNSSTSIIPEDKLQLLLLKAVRYAPTRMSILINVLALEGSSLLFGEKGEVLLKCLAAQLLDSEQDREQGCAILALMTLICELNLNHVSDANNHTMSTTFFQVMDKGKLITSLLRWLHGNGAECYYALRLVRASLPHTHVLAKRLFMDLCSFFSLNQANLIEVTRWYPDATLVLRDCLQTVLGGKVLTRWHSIISKQGSWSSTIITMMMICQMDLMDMEAVPEIDRQQTLTQILDFLLLHRLDVNAHRAQLIDQCYRNIMQKSLLRLLEGTKWKVTSSNSQKERERVVLSQVESISNRLLFISNNFSLIKSDERTKLKDQITTLQVSLQNSSNQLHSANKELFHVRASLDRTLHDHHKTVEQMNQTMTEFKLKNETIIETLTFQLSTLQNELEMSKGERMVLIGELQALQEHCDKLVKENTDEKHQLGVRHQEKLGEQERLFLNQKQAALDELNTRYEVEINELKALYNLDRLAMQEELESTQIKINAQSTELKTIREELCMHMVREKELQAELDQIRAQLVLRESQLEKRGKL